MSRYLLPLIPAGLTVKQVLSGPDSVTIIAAPTASRSTCPVCNVISGKVHSHYIRTLADLPWQGRAVRLQVEVRRFRCDRADCLRRIFTERLPDLVLSRARRTMRLSDIQRQIGFALGGEPGTRLAERLGMAVSGDTLLRLVRSTPRQPAAPPRVVGIDDWAWRRGQSYGTIICDLERRRVLDLLPDRRSETVADWLRQHPSVEVIARDRAGAYAEGSKQGAPSAKQVADRWHLLRNLGDALQSAVDRHRSAVRRAARAVAHDQPAPAEVEETGHCSKQQREKAARRERRCERYEELRRLHTSGMSVGIAAASLGMSAVAAYRWLRAGGPPSHEKPVQPRALDPYVVHLQTRWQAGCRNGHQLWREIREQGFPGAVNAVARWIAERRRADPPPRAAEVRRTAAWPAPSSRHCAQLLTTDDTKLDAAERKFLSHLSEIAPALSRAGKLATQFAALARDDQQRDKTQALEAWTADTRGTELDGFVRGLERDHAAVLAALVEPWSTSPVEGQINRLKLLKRSMYGRAGYDLLRQRVLAA